MILAMVAALAPLPANEIAPPLDVPIRQLQSESRDDGRNRRTFRLERTLRFSAEPGGYRVVVTTLSADAEADQADRDRYRAANRGLLGLTFTVHLDRAGQLRAVDDLDSVWAAWSAGLAAAQGGSAGTADAAVKRLGSLTADQRTTLIGSIVTTIIAPADERSTTTERPVTLASPPPFGEITLVGTKIATIIDGLTVTRITAAGSSPSGDARIGLTSADTVDPKSGLLTTATTRTTTSTHGGILAVQKSQTLIW